MSNNESIARTLVTGARTAPDFGASVWQGSPATVGYLVGVPRYGMRVSATMEDETMVRLVTDWIGATVDAPDVATWGSWSDEEWIFFDRSAFVIGWHEARNMAEANREIAFWDIWNACEVRTHDND